MKKSRIMIFALMMAILISSYAYAYTWVTKDDGYYVYSDVTNEIVKSTLVDVGDGVYYFDEYGKMVTGWWVNNSSGKVYFFNNNSKKAYGSMVFGLHMIDGYYRYFNDDGSLAASEKDGDYIKVYQEFYADSKGNIYYNNALMRDTSTNKSEFYSDPTYYTNDLYNNEYFAKNGSVEKVGLMIDGSSGKTFAPGSQMILSQGNFSGDKPINETHSEVTGGTDYYIDEHGNVTYSNSTTLETSEFELLGPAQEGAPAPSAG